MLRCFSGQGDKRRGTPLVSDEALPQSPPPALASPGTASAPACAVPQVVRAGSGVSLGI